MLSAAVDESIPAADDESDTAVSGAAAVEDAESDTRSAVEEEAINSTPVELLIIVAPRVAEESDETIDEMSREPVEDDESVSPSAVEERMSPVED